MRELVVRRSAGQETGLPGALLTSLASLLRGHLVFPESNDYDQSRRVWNGLIDRRPAFIARCQCTADVSACVRLAREHDLLFSVRGGGHNVAGRSVCDGGLVIDLGEMRAVDVDLRQQRVAIAGGALLGDVDRATVPMGMATPMGVVTETGYAGLTLHGGMGWQLRKHGLAADNLIEAEVVTAEGVLRARPGEHDDLLWALRGGGGNFGVVTSFLSRLHPIPQVVSFAVPIFALERASSVLGFLRDFVAQAPDELSLLVALWTAPDESFVLPEHRGRPALFVLACALGPAEEGARLLRPLRECQSVIADLSSVSSWTAVQSFFDADYPRGRRYYWKSTFVPELTPEIIEVLLAQTDRRPSRLSSIDLWPLGGAYARVPSTETPFGDRSAGFMVNYEANWLAPDDDQSNIEWVRQGLKAIEPWSAQRTYLNFAGFAEEGERLLERTYGDNYQRLRAIKQRYDPHNLFRSNFNVVPRTG